PAAQAFGPVNPDNQQRFPRYTFPPDMALSENLLVEFADVSGYKQAGRIVQIGMHDVEIDFNHPLAGRDILFTAIVHRVENLSGNEKQTHE
ncbi:MAG: peptidylprolyl isomerase, partial [Pseudomonadota bacterium]